MSEKPLSSPFEDVVLKPRWLVGLWPLTHAEVMAGAVRRSSCNGFSAALFNFSHCNKGKSEPMLQRWQLVSGQTKKKRICNKTVVEGKGLVTSQAGISHGLQEGTKSPRRDGKHVAHSDTQLASCTPGVPPIHHSTQHGPDTGDCLCCILGSYSFCFNAINTEPVAFNCNARDVSYTFCSLDNTPLYSIYCT